MMKNLLRFSALMSLRNMLVEKLRILISIYMIKDVVGSSVNEELFQVRKGNTDVIIIIYVLMVYLSVSMDV